MKRTHLWLEWVQNKAGFKETDLTEVPVHGLGRQEGACKCGEINISRRHVRRGEGRGLQSRLKAGLIPIPPTMSSSRVEFLLVGRKNTPKEVKQGIFTITIIFATRQGCAA